MNSIVGLILMIGAATLFVVSQIFQLSWIIALTVLVLLFPLGMAFLLGTDDKARDIMAKTGGGLLSWLADNNGFSLWEAVALGLLVFGFFAGKEFLGLSWVYLAAFLAPWLAGFWAANRGGSFAGLLSPAAGAIVGLTEGSFFLAWLQPEWREFPASALTMAVAALIGAGLGFWAYARGRMKRVK
jgi:hypothetical protein